MDWHWMFRLFSSELLCVIISVVVVIASTEDTTNEEVLFRNFINKNKRPYEKGSEEYRFRFKVFQEALRRINELNRQSGETLYGITQFSDYTPQEFKTKALKYFSLIKPQSSRGRRSIVGNGTLSALPLRVDWRNQEVIAEIRNQGECGGCWAISVVEAIETMSALKTGKLVPLSAQQVIDCALNGLYGCQGGDTCITLTWMNMTKVHLVTEEEYPFTRTTGICKMKDPPKGVQVKDFTCTSYRNNESFMMELLATHGPLIAAVDAALWQDYLGGVIKYHCEHAHNHAVQIVGYDRTGPVPYYIVRNSWGSSFGLDGYLHVAIGKNLCGIADEVSTVEVL